MPSMQYMIEAAIKPFMIPFDRSAKVVQRRLLSHSELCESCKKIPKLVAKVSSRNKEIKDNHHATLSALESAANKGCRLCDPLWKWYLQDLAATQPPGLNTRDHRGVGCRRSVFQLVASNVYLMQLVISTANGYVIHAYTVQLVAGKVDLLLGSEAQGY